MLAFFLYILCYKIVLRHLCFLHFFFQSYSKDIDALPEALVGRVALLPELEDSRASNAVKSYIHGFNRWQLWALSNGSGGKDILPGKAFHVALY